MVECRATVNVQETTQEAKWGLVVREALKSTPRGFGFNLSTMKVCI